MRLPLLLPLLSALAACGGSGGATPVVPDTTLRMAATGTTVAQGVTAATVDLALTTVPAGAVLLQFDVVMDRTRLGPATGRASLEALQSRPTVDGDDVDGAFRVVFGDGRNADPRSLATGPFLRLHLETRPPRTPGEVAVQIAGIRAVDAAGTALAVDGAPVGATVILR